MTTAFPYKSGTLLIPSGPSHDPDRKHLFIICSDECAQGKFALVPVASWINDLCDGACRIEKGEHPFIIRDSYVLYRKARVEKRVDIEARVRDAVFSVHKDVSAALLIRIQNGLCASLQTPRWIKTYFGCEALSSNA